jgi:hypothetical protein
MNQRARIYAAGAAGILAFILAQTFQELAYALWIPASRGAADDLRIMLLPIDRARALAILLTIIGLLVPYTALAIDRFKRAPLASVLGLIFIAVFVIAEIFPRSIELFVFARPGASLDHWIVVQEIEHGWFFVTLSAYFLASVAFAVATWRDTMRWHWLAPAAFTLNGVRLIGRMASMFAGQSWLDPLNGAAYYPVVLVVNAALFAWFVLQAVSSPTPSPP